MYRTVVTICTTSLTFTNATFCPHNIFVCFIWISEQTAIISLYNINWLVFINETECVYCAVRTVYVIYIDGVYLNLYDGWKLNIKGFLRKMPYVMLVISWCLPEDITNILISCGKQVYNVTSESFGCVKCFFCHCQLLLSVGFWVFRDHVCLHQRWERDESQWVTHKDCVDVNPP